MAQRKHGLSGMIELETKVDISHQNILDELSKTTMRVELIEAQLEEMLKIQGSLEKNVKKLVKTVSTNKN